MSELREFWLRHRVVKTQDLRAEDAPAQKCFPLCFSVSLFQGAAGGGTTSLCSRARLAGGTTSWLQHFGAPARRGEAPGFSEVHPWICFFLFFGFTWHRRRSEFSHWLLCSRCLSVGCLCLLHSVPPPCQMVCARLNDLRSWRARQTKSGGGGSRRGRCVHAMTDVPHLFLGERTKPASSVFRQASERSGRDPL